MSDQIRLKTLTAKEVADESEQLIQKLRKMNREEDEEQSKEKVE